MILVLVNPRTKNKKQLLACQFDNGNNGGGCGLRKCLSSTYNLGSLLWGQARIGIDELVDCVGIVEGGLLDFFDVAHGGRRCWSRKIIERRWGVANSLFQEGARKAQKSSKRKSRW